MPVGRQPGAGAVSAERLGDAGDDAHLAGAIAVAIALRHLAAVVGVDRIQRPARIDALGDLGGGHHVVEPPSVGMPDVHVLDEAHHDAAAAEVLREVEDGVLVDAAAHDRVHLDRPEAGGLGRRDPVEDARDGEADVVHAHERRVVERVEAHRHAPQAGIGQSPRLRAQQRGVRRHRQVADARDRGQHARPAVSRLRRTSGSPPVSRTLRTPSPTASAHDALDLLEVEDLGPRQEDVIRAEHFLGHAVHAPEVAPIGDADAQVMHRPTERVEDGGGGRHLDSIVAPRAGRRKRAGIIRPASSSRESHGMGLTAKKRSKFGRSCPRFAADAMHGQVGAPSWPLVPPGGNPRTRTPQVGR